MAPKIQHKRSAVAGKAPLPADLDYGEIGVNYEASDPALYIKDTANAVRKISSHWDRTGTVVSPSTAGDDVDLGTGNLTASSINNGQLAGFRNVLINGSLAINQRGVTIAAAAVGKYGPDRWKKVDAGNMTQIVEAGSFTPGAQYTLSGTGVTTQQLTAPATGDWTIPNVPITATNIQLEPGPVATPFEHRPIGIELALCQRYYCADEGYIRTSGTFGGPRVLFPSTMRAVPTVSPAQIGGFGNTLAAHYITSGGAGVTGNLNAVGELRFNYTADAEL